MQFKLFALIGSLALGSGCATEIVQAGKSHEETQADIQSCSDEAKREYWYDAISALDHAYDCLRRRGYRKARSEFAIGLPADDKPAGPVQPCRVPCK